MFTQSRHIHVLQNRPRLVLSFSGTTELYKYAKTDGCEEIREKLLRIYMTNIRFII